MLLIAGGVALVMFCRTSPGLQVHAAEIYRAATHHSVRCGKYAHSGVENIDGFPSDFIDPVHLICGCAIGEYTERCKFFAKLSRRFQSLLQRRGKRFSAGSYRICEFSRSLELRGNSLSSLEGYTLAYDVVTLLGQLLHLFTFWPLPDAIIDLLNGNTCVRFE